MKVLCCGDSHTKVFHFCNQKQSKYLFDVCKVSGATAQGAVNPNSKTDALNLFQSKIKSTDADKILIMLGEVDCGFLIWVRSKRYNISIDEQIELCVQNLFTFVHDIINTSKYKSDDIIIVGAVLPTICDSTNKQFLCGARSEVNVSQLKRTAKTIEYNALLKNKCKENGYHYIEITDTILGENGLVRSGFLNKDPNDHHLCDEKTYQLWLTELNTIFSL
jgi:hypothetical protein